MSSPVNVNATPTPATIEKAGNAAVSAVNSAAKVAATLNDVSKQLKEAANSLRKSAPAIASVASNVAVTNAPAAAQAVAPIIGGARASMLMAMPRSVISGGAREAVNAAAKQLDDLADGAKNAGKAVNSGLNAVKNGAKYVANNATLKNANMYNNAVNNNANRFANSARNGLNSAANANILPPLNIKANVGTQHVNAVKNAANKVMNAANNNLIKNNNNNNYAKTPRKYKMNGGRRSSRTRKAKAGGFFAGLF